MVGLMLGLKSKRGCSVVSSLGPIRLRTFVDDDLDWYAELIADPLVMRFIGDGRPRERDRAATEIEGFQAEQANRGWSRWVAERVADSAPMGFVGFSLRHGEVDYGARAFRRFWGSRHTVVAGIAAIEAGLIACGIEDATAITDARNKRPIQFNSRLGFSAPTTISRAGRSHVRQTISRRVFLADGWLERNRALAARWSAREPSPVTV